MSEILFLAHRIPFPPDRGDKIRSHHILRGLARIAPVHVATFGETDEDMAHEESLAWRSKSHLLVRRSKSLALAGLQALAGHSPVSLTAFHDPRISAYVERVLATRPIGAIYVFSGQMGQYVPSTFAGRIVADFVDVDSAKFEAFAARRLGLRRWIDAREARLLHAEEVRIARRANVSLLISEAEVELFRSRLPPDLRDTTALRVLANGIDAESFYPGKVESADRMRACEGPRLIFTGQMDYAPNVAAAERIAQRILPLIRQRLPSATFHIVGRNPPARLMRRHGRGGLHVWGGVPDMREWLRAADLALIPLEIGRGVQNKVLEAMAMRLPVVLTGEAATGIAALDGQDFLIADSDADLARAAIDLLGDPERMERMGQAARAFVIDNMSWPAALVSLPEIIGLLEWFRRDVA